MLPFKKQKIKNNYYSSKAIFRQERENIIHFIQFIYIYKNILYYDYLLFYNIILALDK